MQYTYTITMRECKMDYTDRQTAFDAFENLVKALFMSNVEYVHFVQLSEHGGLEKDEQPYQKPHHKILREYKQYNNNPYNTTQQ